MADTPRITVGSAAATALQSSIQANLALRSWAEEDDAVMAEYGKHPLRLLSAFYILLTHSKHSASHACQLQDCFTDQC